MEIKDIQLFEVSFVNEPLNPACVITKIAVIDDEEED